MIDLEAGKAGLAHSGRGVSRVPWLHCFLACGKGEGMAEEGCSPQDRQGEERDTETRGGMAQAGAVAALVNTCVA